jgi:hypothetical protein
VNYKRTLYVLDPTDMARQFRGKYITVHESEDGRVSMRHGALHLPAIPFPREQAHVDQGSIVENKLLGTVLADIRAKQQVRTEQALA